MPKFHKGNQWNFKTRGVRRRISETLKGTKLITIHTKNENICIHIHPQSFWNLKDFINVDEPIGVWSNRAICWPNKKVRVKPAPIEVIDHRAVIRSRDFRPWEKRRPMEFRSTSFWHGLVGLMCNALSHGRARCYPYRCTGGLGVMWKVCNV